MRKKFDLIWLLVIIPLIFKDIMKTDGKRTPWISIGWLIVIICVIALGSAIVNSWYPRMKTNRILQVNINAASKDDWQTCTNLVDGWGNLIVYQRLAGEKAIVYSMTSCGKDELAGTKDDISVSLVDLNKSRIVGEWVGKKSHEATKGIIDGWKEKSKFKDNNE